MKKIIILGVVFLFVGVGFTSGIGVNVEQTSYPLNGGELAWWEFNEGSGTIAHDSSGHEYDGTVYGATWTADGLSFDGTDDYVDFDNHSVALGITKYEDYVIQVRFSSTGSCMLYSMSHTNPDKAYFDLMLDEEGKITVEMGDETCLFTLSSSITVNDGDWHLAEIYFEGSTTNPTLTIKVDGSNQGSVTEWLCPMLDEDFLTAKVGRDSNAETDYFVGEIDDIKIYKSYSYRPPKAPTIEGPVSGNPGQTLTYIFNAVDPDGDDVRFHIDWRDENEEWTTYVGSGVDKIVTHQWSSPGFFEITAYAEDITGLIGPSTKMTIAIPRNKSINTPILNFLQSHPNLFPLLQRLLDVWRFNS